MAQVIKVDPSALEGVAARFDAVADDLGGVSWPAGLAAIGSPRVVAALDDFWDSWERQSRASSGRCRAAADFLRTTAIKMREADTPPPGVVAVLSPTTERATHGTRARDIYNARPNANGEYWDYGKAIGGPSMTGSGCFAYAMMRRFEVGHDDPRPTRSGALQGGTSSGSLRAGALAFWGNQTASPTHTMFVEAVIRDSGGNVVEIEISEANYPLGHGVRTRILKSQPDGLFVVDGHTLRFSQ